MEIAGSSLSLSSTQTKIQFYQRKETLVISGPGPAGGTGAPSPDADPAGKGAVDPVALSEGGARRARQAQESEAAGHGSQFLMKDLNIRMLKDLVERLTGKEIRMSDISRAYKDGGAEPPAVDPVDAEASAPAPESVGWGLDYRLEETRAESETTTVHAQGHALTKDGREIDISVSLSMSREFVQKEHIHIQAGDAVLKDPLVLNFDGTAAQLTQTRFAFDLDCDGKSDQLRTLSPGTGFLALDKNQDNVINDGSELFGPASGHGFSELAAYDTDGNHWIDEADDIYDKLRIWTHTPSGEPRLFALAEKGIGAICLAHVASSFDLKDPENQLLGQVRETGVFLHEDGGPGTVQELDLLV